MARVFCLAAVLALSFPAIARAQSIDFSSVEPFVTAHCPAIDADAAPRPQDPLTERLLRYLGLGGKHKMAGLASYYSTFFDGRKTANGEIYRNKRFSAAHLTLPLGSWIEVRSRGTGRTLRMRVNDRGPYARKFTLDLSQAAARYLGVDKHRDRFVEFRVIALPGEQPLPDEVDWTLAESLPTSGNSETTLPTTSAAAAQ